MTTSKKTQKLIKHFMSAGVLNTPDISVDPIASVRNFKVKAPNTGAQDFASYMLTHTSGDKGVAKSLGKSLASRGDAQEEKASVLSSIFDTLSIPLYSAAHGFESMAEVATGKGGTKDNNFFQNVGHELEGFAQGAGAGADRLGAAALGLIPGHADPFDLKKTLNERADKLAPKRTGQNILHDQFGVDNKVARYGGGFALDVAMDPLTFVGGFGKSGAKAAKDVLDVKAAAGVAPEGGLVDAFNKAKGAAFHKPSKPMLGGASVAETAVSKRMVTNPLHESPVPKIKRNPSAADPQPMMDAVKFAPRTKELERRWGQLDEKIASRVNRGLEDIPDPARTTFQKQMRAQGDWERAMMKAGKVAEPTGRYSPRAATQVVNDILSGKTARYAVQAPKATGEAAQTARNIADDVIDSLMGPKRATASMPQRTGSFLRREKIKEVHPGKQIALYNKILRDGGLKEGNFDEARAMLAAAEDHMIALGVQPVGHSGMRLRLSDVIEATHGKVPFAEVMADFTKADPAKMNPITRAAIHGITAERSLGVSEIVANLSGLAEKSRRELINFSPIERPMKESEILKTSIDAAMQRGMTNKEIAAVKDLVKDIVDVDKLPTEKWFETAYPLVKQAAIEGRIDRKVVVKFQEAITHGLGLTPEKIAKDVSGYGAIDRFMSTFTTWWGKGEWANLSKDVFDVGVANANMRLRTMREMANKYNPEQVRAAWHHATGSLPAEDPGALELANYFHNYMRTVLKVQEHGFNASNALTKELSVGEKSMAMMEDINRTLKQMNGAKAFQFINKKNFASTANGTRRISDYSKGSDWMKSWQEWNPSDPVAFMYDMDVAMERVTKEYSFLDSFVGTFGSTKQTATHNYFMNIPRVKGFWVPEEHGKAIQRVMMDLYKGGYHPTSQAGRMYNKGLRIWKTGVTIYLPSHHVRNAIGDINLMWLAGHNDPRHFIYARRIMASQRTKYKDIVKRGDFDAMEQLTSPEAMEWAKTSGDHVILNVKGKKLTADQIYISAYQHGLLRDAYAMEDIVAEAPLGELSANANKLKKITQSNIVKRPLGGKAHDAATAAAEYREHYIRLAHYTSAITKNLKAGKKLETAMADAAHEVRKFHPDGTDLTAVEQRLRLVIPFYSWIRKSSPLLIQSTVTRPAKVLALPRMNVAMQGMNGIEGTSVGDPFPDDQAFPEWIRSYGIGPIGDPESDSIMGRWWGNLGRNMINPDGSKYGYTNVNPSNPYNDMVAQYGGFGPKDTLQGVWDGVTPFAKVPVEMATGKDFTGAPIYKDEGGQGLLHYLSKQIPFTSPLQRVTNAGDRQREGVEGGLDKEALINMMTALGLRGTGPYIKSAEYEQREQAKAKAAK